MKHLLAKKIESDKLILVTYYFNIRNPYHEVTIDDFTFYSRKIVYCENTGNQIQRSGRYVKGIDKLIESIKKNISKIQNKQIRSE